MWLLAQILVYLLVAFLIGAAGGWMLRGRRAEDTQLHLRERFKQMVSSIEMERDAARLKARDLSARLDALGAGTVDPAPVEASPEIESMPLASRADPTPEAGPVRAEPPSDAPPETDVEPEVEEGAVWSHAPGHSAESADLPAHEGSVGPVSEAGSEDGISSTPVETPVGDPEADESSGPTAENVDESVPQPVDSDASATDSDPVAPAARSGNQWELVEEPEQDPTDSGDAGGPQTGPVDSASDGGAHPLSDLGEVPPDASQRLRALGLGDTSALHEYFDAGADPSELAASLDVAPRRVRRWKTLAELLELPDVEAHHAWLLEIAGVVSLEELSAEDPAELAQRMGHLNRDQALGLPVPEPGTVAAWVEAAGRRQRRG